MRSPPCLGLPSPGPLPAPTQDGDWTGARAAFLGRPGGAGAAAAPRPAPRLCPRFCPYPTDRPPSPKGRPGGMCGSGPGAGAEVLAFGWGCPLRPRPSASRLHPRAGVEEGLEVRGLRRTDAPGVEERQVRRLGTGHRAAPRASEPADAPPKAAGEERAFPSPSSPPVPPRSFPAWKGGPGAGVLLGWPETGPSAGRGSSLRCARRPVLTARPRSQPAAWGEEGEADLSAPAPGFTPRLPHPHCPG